MLFGVAVKSILLGAAIQLFFYFLQAATEAGIDSLTFTPLGFMVCYFSAFATITSLEVKN